MVSCTQCGRELKNAQGLRGHLQFAHKISSSRSGDAGVERATLATVAQLEELRAATIEELELAGEQLRAATVSLLSAVAQLPQHSAEQRQVLEGSDHSPGLCDSGQCARCRDYRKGQGPVVWRQGRKILVEEIDTACEWAGVASARTVVAEAVLAYRAKKQGGPDPEPLDALASLAQGAPDPEPLDDSEPLDALASLAQGALDSDPEPDALTTLLAPDPEPRLTPWPSEW